MASSLAGQPAVSVSVFDSPVPMSCSYPPLSVCSAPSGQPSLVSSLGSAPTMSVSCAGQPFPDASLSGPTLAASIASAPAGHFTLVPSLGARPPHFPYAMPVPHPGYISNYGLSPPFPFQPLPLAPWNTQPSFVGTDHHSLARKYHVDKSSSSNNVVNSVVGCNSVPVVCNSVPLTSNKPSNIAGGRMPASVSSVNSNDTIKSINNVVDNSSNNVMNNVVNTSSNNLPVSSRPGAPPRLNFAAAAAGKTTQAFQYSNLPGVKRPNTLIFKLPIANDARWNRKDIVKELFKHIPEACVHAIQIVPANWCRITFIKLEDKHSFLVRGISFNGVHVNFQEAESSTTFVTLSHLPVEVSSDHISRTLSQFGKVLSVSHQHDPDFRSLLTGNRIVKMILGGRHLPPRIRISGFLATVWYRGMPAMCRLCFRQGHLASTCPYKGRCFRCGADDHSSKDCHPDLVPNPHDPPKDVPVAPLEVESEKASSDSVSTVIGKSQNNKSSASNSVLAHTTPEPKGLADIPASSSLANVISQDKESFSLLDSDDAVMTSVSSIVPEPSTSSALDLIHLLKWILTMNHRLNVLPRVFVLLMKNPRILHYLVRNLTPRRSFCLMWSQMIPLVLRR